MARVGTLALLAFALAATGCMKRTLKAETTEPNPMSLPHADGDLPSSTRLAINLKDMEMPSRFRMANTAEFAVISRDRLRFHVILNHKWKEFTDIENWDVYLEDDRGRRFLPEARDKNANRHRTHMWDYERRSVVHPSQPDSPVLAEGQTVSEDFARGVGPGIANDGYRERVPLASIDTFRGQGDYVFHAPNLFDRSVKRVTLVMQRSGLEYRFTWHLY